MNVMYLEPAMLGTLAEWAETGEGMATIRIEEVVFRPGTADVRYSRPRRLINGFVYGVLINQGDEDVFIAENGDKYEYDEQSRIVPFEHEPS